MEIDESNSPANLLRGDVCSMESFASSICSIAFPLSLSFRSSSPKSIINCFLGFGSGCPVSLSLWYCAYRLSSDRLESDGLFDYLVSCYHRDFSDVLSTFPFWIHLVSSVQFYLSILH